MRWLAETIRIEIPIEAKDNTGAGVRSAQQKLMGLERDMQRMQQTFSRLFGRNQSANIDVGIHDNASDALANIEGHAEQIDHTSVIVDTEANDTASQAMSDVSDSVSALDGESATVEADMDDSATDPLNDVADAVSALNGTSATVGAQTDDGASGPLADIQDAASALDGTSVVIDATVNDQASPVLADLASQAGGAAQSGIGSAAGAVQSGAHSLVGGLGKAAAFAGIALGVGDAINTFRSFESEMSRVEAISGATSGEMEMLTAKAKEMGATTMFTATNAAEAFSYMGMAGWKSGQMMEGIEPIMNLAAASGLDLGRTSDIVTDALTAFGLAAEDTGMFTDVLAAAATNSNTNVDMLGESFKYVAPVAGAMGYSVQDTAVALGIMANAGIKSSMAGTTLRRALTNLASPSTEAAAAMEKYGISLTDSEGNMKSLGDVMTNIRESLGGLDEAEQAAAASTLFGTTAMAGMLAIINATDSDLQSLTDSIYNSEGAASRMMETMMDNLGGSMTLLSSAFEAVQDVLGERLSNYLRPVVDGLTAEMPKIADSITETFDRIDEAFNTDGIQGVATEIGNIIGDIASSFGDAGSEAIEAASGFMSNLISSLGSEENSADIGGAAAKIITTLGENFLTLTGEAGVAAGNLLLGLVNGLNEEGAGERIGEAGKNLVTNLGNWFSEHGSEFGEAAGNLVAGLATNLAENSGEIISAGIDIMSGLGQGIIRGGAVLIGELPNIAGNLIEGIVNNIPKVLEAGKAIGLALADGIKSAASAIDEAIHFISHYGEVSDETKEFVEDNASSVQTAMQSLLDSGWAEGEGIDMSLAGTEGSAANFISEWAKAGMTVEEVAKAVDEAMVPGADSAQLGVMQNAESVYGALTNAAADLVQAEQDAAAAEAEMASNVEDTGSAMDDAAESATGYSEELQAAVDAASEGLEGTGLEESAANMAEGFEAAKEEVSSMADEVEGIGESVTEAFDGLGEIGGDTLSEILGSEDMAATAEQISSAMNTAAEGISTAFSTMGPAVSESMTSISESATSAGEALTAIQEAATSASEGVATAIQGISDSFSQLGELGSIEGGSVAGQMLTGITETLSQVNEQITEAFAEPIEAEATVSVTVSPGEEVSGIESVTSGIETSLTEAFATPAEVEATVNVTVSPGEADPTPAKTDFDAKAQETFNTPAQVNATVDVVNVSLGAVSGLEAAYAAFAAQAQAAFSVPVSVTGTVNVTTSANVSGGAAQSAEGRFVDGPLLSWVGEDGPEYIIPVGDKRTSRGMELWMQAGEALGAFDEGGFPAFADGGYVGGSSPSPDYSGYISSGSGGGGGGASPEVIISMSPNFTVNSSGDGKETADEIRRMMLNMTDDIAAEMGRRLKEAYANMPR